jgi:hypothetical protein
MMMMFTTGKTLRSVRLIICYAVFLILILSLRIGYFKVIAVITIYGCEIWVLNCSKITNIIPAGGELYEQFGIYRSIFEAISCQYLQAVLLYTMK